MEVELKKELREYQKEALEYALSFNDAVCVLPTGTGKTLIGIAWAVELLNKGLVKRVLVLEPSRFLVEQTWKRYKEDTTFSESDVNVVYGIISKEEREKQEIWKKGTIVVCTPHTAINDIQFLENFDAVIIDECHHTTGEYAYVKLLSQYNFKYKLGLTATLSEKVRSDVEKYISKNIRVWTWEELKAKYPQYKFPDWIGEVYDAELNEKEIKFLKSVEKVPFYPSLLNSLCIRMFTRDGALALKETLENPNTKLSKQFPEELKKELSDLRELHKIEVVENILNEHDFEKAIIFVDRVCVAEKIAERFQTLNPVLFLGRLRLGLEGQKETLERAQRPEHKLIISTSAGEEGVDLPTADLLIIWSNVVSPIRFIQRHGRISRPSEKLKVVTYVATPGTPEINSPDYDSLVEGLILAKENGLDIAGLEDEEFIKILKTKSFRNRIISLLESHPLKFDEIAESLGIKERGKSKLKNWLTICLKEKDEKFRLFYFYYFPFEEIKAILDEVINEYKKGKIETPLDLEALGRMAINRLSKLTRENRIYVPFQMIESLYLEKEFSKYFPSPLTLDIPFFIEYRVNKIDKGKKNILEGFLSYYDGEFKIWLNLYTVIVGNRDEFQKIIRELYKHIRDEYVEIVFFTHGKHLFMPLLSFNGRFNEKSLELVFRNVFYVMLNMKNLLDYLRSKSVY
jgi:superfamily II DNA or RNA helicase